MRADIKYRADVDGLRAVAVMLVVLYHYRVGPFTGGFIGVDAFFVISGYLITNILWREISSGQFSLYRFYERRLRRIAPPLLVVIAFTLAAGWFVLLPPDYDLLGRQAISSIFGVSNFYFRSVSDYFDRSAALNPLLHTWSLSVEEQFYLAWPLALAISWSASRRFPRMISVRTMIEVVIAASFILAVVKVFDNPAKAFYLPVYRAWELALGGLLVFLPPLRGRLSSEAAPLAGITLVVGSALLISGDHPFPGLLALFPCLGAALIIWPRHGGSVAGHLLSTAPMVWIGKLSYSLYLWHWPLLVLFRHEHYGEYPGIEMSLLMIGLCFLLAWFTWAFVETPIRNRQRVSGRMLAVCGIPFALAVGLSALTISGMQGFPGRLPRDIVLNDPQWQSPLRQRCHMRRLGKLPPDGKCVLGFPGAEPDTFVWGDSHGIELSDALSRRFAKERRSLMTLTVSGCPPVISYSSADRPHCAEDNARVADYITKDLPSVKTVVLASYHLIYPRRVGDRYASGLVETVRLLASAGKTVIVVGPIPELSDSVPLIAARMAWRGEQHGPAITRAQWDDQRRAFLPMIDAIGHIEGATVIDPSSVFCDTRECRFTWDERPLLFDSNHPSMDGATQIAQLLSEDLKLPQATPPDDRPSH